MKHLWKRQGQRMIFDAGIFRLREDSYSYRDKQERPYYVLEAAPWVNVVATTDRNELVLVRQYRHGVEELSLEIPGGIMDPGDADPAGAAARELLEETGYGGAPLTPLLTVTSNPAILTNRTHSFLARGVRPVAPPSPDHGEDLEVVLWPVERAASLIRDNRMHHSLSVAAVAAWLLDPDT